MRSKDLKPGTVMVMRHVDDTGFGRSFPLICRKSAYDGVSIVDEDTGEVVLPGWWTDPVGESGFADLVIDRYVDDENWEITFLPPDSPITSNEKKFTSEVFVVLVDRRSAEGELSGRIYVDTVFRSRDEAQSRKRDLIKQGHWTTIERSTLKGNETP